MVTKRKLRELCSKIGSGATPKGGSSVYIDAGISLIRSQNIYDSGFKYDGLAFITDEAAKQLQGVEVKRGDVLLNITGDSIGRCVIVPDDVLPARVNQHVMILRPNANLSSEYLFAYLSLPATKNDLLNYDSGGTRKAFTKAMLENYEVPAPPIETQQEIGQFLYLFNQKIELNRRMNQTLEQLAQALFKQWFVAFNLPISDVDSAQEMLQKKLAPMLLGGGVKFPEIIELYQEHRSGGEELLESELGEISKGWRVGKLSNLIDFDPKTPIKKGTKTRFLAMAEVPTQGFAIRELEERPYIGGAKFRLADTLLARITPCLENGKTAYVDFLNQEEIAAGSTEFIVMRGKHNVPSEFVYCLARSAEFRKYAIAQMVGTSGRQRVSTDSLKNYLFPIPKGESLVKFGLISKPLFARISANNTQSRTLATLRDTLLPQLLSGRLTVRQAAAMVA